MDGVHTRSIMRILAISGDTSTSSMPEGKVHSYVTASLDGTLKLWSSQSLTCEQTWNLNTSIDVVRTRKEVLGSLVETMSVGIWYR